MNPGTVAGGVVVKTTQGTLGEYLTDGQGKSLYLFQSDTSGVSNCTGQCATTWPPLTVPAGQSATAQGDANMSLLGSITRSDGSTQVTYKGMPLYYYIADKSAGDTKGQGIFESGNFWYLVKPDGTKLGS